MKLMEGTLASVLKSIGSYGLRLEVPAELASLSSASSSSPPLYPLPPLPSLPSFPSFQGLPPLQSPSLSKGPTTSELIGSERVYSHGESSHSPTSGLGVPATTNQSTPGEEPRLHALPPDSLQPFVFFALLLNSDEKDELIVVRSFAGSQNGSSGRVSDFLEFS